MLYLFFGKSKNIKMLQQKNHQSGLNTVAIDTSDINALSKIRKTSSGPDEIPSWVWKEYVIL